MNLRLIRLSYHYAQYKEDIHSHSNDYLYRTFDYVKFNTH